MKLNLRSRDTAAQKELLSLEKQEARMAQAAQRAKPGAWKTALEEKVPEKVYTGLESAFSKGFSVLFSQGRGIIEKGYKKEELRADHALRDRAVRETGGRRELKQLHRQANRSNLWNMAVTTAEGIGLGALGIGMPDIVLFLGTLLKGIYETALNYGFEYESPQEQLLILKMMETALCQGDSWLQKNREVNEMLELETLDLDDAMLRQQLQATASAFAMDMLLLKFIQGLPVVGILGGAANPVYYNKVMKYVRLKYRKRYLLKQTAGAPISQ